MSQTLQAPMTSSKQPQPKKVAGPKDEVFRFRLLAGSYTGIDPTDGQEKMWMTNGEGAGNIVPSLTDLSIRFGREKFERLSKNTDALESKQVALEEENASLKERLAKLEQDAASRNAADANKGQAKR